MAQRLILKKLKLDMKNIPLAERNEAKTAIGEYILNETFRHLERGKSPVQGEPSFKILQKKYAKEEKQGNRTPNLNLEGDLREATDFKIKPYGLDFGVVNRNKKENDKADGHNQFSSKAIAWARKIKFPKRRYVPDAKQEYTPKIQKGIETILKQYRVSEEPVGVREDFSNEDEGVGITITDVLGGL